MQHICRHFLIWAIGLIFVAPNVFAQSGAGRISFGLTGLASKYWGEYTDNQIWFGGDAFIRDNITPAVSLSVVAAVAQLRYKLSSIGSANDQVTYIGSTGQPVSTAVSQVFGGAVAER